MRERERDLKKKMTERHRRIDKDIEKEREKERKVIKRRTKKKGQWLFKKEINEENCYKEKR